MVSFDCFVGHLIVSPVAMAQSLALTKSVSSADVLGGRNDPTIHPKSALCLQMPLIHVLVKSLRVGKTLE